MGGNARREVQADTWIYFENGVKEGTHLTTTY